MDQVKGLSNWSKNRFKRNLATFASESRADEALFKTIEEWDDKALQGLARLTDNGPNSRYVKKLIDDLGDQAPEFFKLVHKMAEESSSLKITAGGLKRFQRHRKNSPFGIKDIEKINKSLSRPPKGTLHGNESERLAIGWYQKNSNLDVIDLNDPSLQKRYGPGLIKKPYGHQMPVVDAALQNHGDKRKFVSFADGGLKYSVDKYEKLLGLQEADNHKSMLEILREFGIKDEREFFRRAEIQVPGPHMDALKLVIVSRLDEPVFVAIRRKYGLSIDDMLNMIRPLPISYYDRR